MVPRCSSVVPNSYGRPSADWRRQQPRSASLPGSCTRTSASARTIGTVGILDNLGDPSTNRWGFRAVDDLDRADQRRPSPYP